MAVGAIALLLIGAGVGFAIGRATAPKVVVPAPSPTTQAETTLPVSAAEDSLTINASDTIETTVTDEGIVSDETTEDTEAPTKPKQLAPEHRAVIDASHVTLKWSKSTDDSGEKVTYSFEIQDRKSDGEYGNTQVITKLESRSYSARVLSVRRRWRVWAVDAAGNKSSKSRWHSYIHEYEAPTNDSSSGSTNTTTTEG